MSFKLCVQTMKASVVLSLWCLMFFLPKTDTAASPTPPSPLDAMNTTKDNKPLIILHVGPPKTSTTTLQYYLSRYADTLAQENYLYVGRVYDAEGNYQQYFNMEFLQTVDYKCQMGYEPEEEAQCDEQKGEAEDKDSLWIDGLWKVYDEYSDDETIDWTYHVDTPACWKAFLVELQRVKRSGMNVIVSDEMFSIRGYKQNPFHFHMLNQTLSRDWHVRVLVTYRRFHAWLPSAKNEYDKYQRYEEDGYEWNGKPSLSMFEVIQEGLRDPDEIIYPYVDFIVEHYVKFFPVDVLNMHDLGSYPTLASLFVCKFVPNAIKTCQLSLEDTEATSDLRLNTARSSFYDSLTMAAYKQGLVTEAEGDRESVRDLIQKEHEMVHGMTPWDFDLICPEKEELQPLLERSLEHEETFFPEFHRSEVGHKKHVEEFWNMYDKKRYCTIDTDATLKYSRWLTFFEKLKNKKTGEEMTEE